MLKSSAFLNSFFMPSQSVFQCRKTLSSGLELDGRTAAPGDNLFARLLAKTTPIAVSGGDRHVNPFFLIAKDSSAAVSGLKKNGEDHSPFSTVLESAFLTNGVSLDTVVLSREDFDFLARVLEEMGFSKSSLKSFFQEIKENRSDGLVTLAHFLKDLSGFEQAEARKSTTSTSLTDSIDKSAVPHLELILRDLDVPFEKIDSLLSFASRKTGAIDIEKLVFQLKSYVDGKEKNSGAIEVADKDLIAKDANTNGLQTDSSTVQRLASGLEKLGLSVPKKEADLPFTLEMLIQSLEKKVGQTASTPTSIPREATRVVESVMAMPAVKAMAMEKTETYFGFAWEMMVDKQNKPGEKGPTDQKIESGQLNNHQNSMPGDEKFQDKHSLFSHGPSGLFVPDRQMGIPGQAPPSVKRMDHMLSAATRESGEIDIEKLLFQLKSYADAKGNKTGAAQVTLNSAKSMSGHQDQQSDLQVVQRVISGLEKLGLSVPNKASHLPFTLEMVVQFLEKKVQESASVSKNSSMDAHRVVESVHKKAAGNSMKMAKIEPDFRVGRERVNGKQRQSDEKSFVRQNIGLQNLFSEKKVGDISKGDGAGRQEIHQNLMLGGEKIQGSGISFANVTESVSIPVKQTAAFQQSSLPTAVVNQVGKEIASFLHRGDRVFTLQLKPPELGMVNIEMDVKENVLKMSVVTETSSAKEMLHANYVDLKRVLEGYGVRVETFDIQLNSNLNHTSSNGDSALNQHHSQGGMGKNRYFGKSSGETAEENNGELPASPQTNNESRLDLLA